MRSRLSKNTAIFIGVLRGLFDEIVIAKGKKMKMLTIGRLACRAGVGIETIRFYERKGLLDQPPRSPAGYRQYPPEAVQRLMFIRRAKELGFTLGEIGELLALGSNPGTTCADVRQRAARKRDDIDRRIRDLGKMRLALDMLLASCPGDAPSDQCPILQALAGQE